MNDSPQAVAALPRSFFDEQTRRHRQTYFFLVLGVVWMALMACLIVDAHAGLFRQFGNQISQSEVRRWCIVTSCLSVGLWGLVALILLTSSSRVLPLLVGAHLAKGMDEQVLGNVAQEIGIAAGEIPSNVRWFILNTSDQNAFACGRSVNEGSIVVTRGLLECLDRNELQAVVAHELAHLKNGDSQFIVSALAFAWMVIGVCLAACMVLVSAVVLMALAMVVIAKCAEGWGAIIAVVIGIVLFIAGLFYLAAYALMLSFLLGLVAVGVKAAASSISQTREYLADACAAQWTRNPLALASALAKIRGGTHTINAKGNFLSPLWLDHPSPEKTDKLAMRLLSFLLHTHPQIERRIELLRDMAGSGVVTEAHWLAVMPNNSQRTKEWVMPVAATVLAVLVGVLLVCDLIQWV